MKHTLILVFLLAVSGCAAWPQSSSSQSDLAPSSLWTQLPGVYDNHEQVWQAAQTEQKLLPVHIRHRIESLGSAVGPWRWTLSLMHADGSKVEATWRYQARTLEDGSVLLTPQRALPAAAEEDPEWATLAPCAMRGDLRAGRLDVAADVAACSAILPGLGAEAALLPVRMVFDGQNLDVATFADQARGSNASGHAVRVRWFDGWVAINGAGPEAQADDKDWHTQRDLRLHDQGGIMPILWRDGQPSGYSLQLEQLTYAERGTRVLKLSLIRDADHGTVAYAWANADATSIGINLGWIQTGLSLAAPPG